MDQLEVHAIRALRYQRTYIVRAPHSNAVLVIDPIEPHFVGDFLRSRGWDAKYVLNTRVCREPNEAVLQQRGIEDLVETFSACVIGSVDQLEALPQIEIALNESESFDFEGHPMQLFNLFGLANQSLISLFPADRILFAGSEWQQMSFRIQEQAAVESFWRKTQWIRALPEATRVYFSSDGRIANLIDAKFMEPHNPALIENDDAIAKTSTPEHLLTTKLETEVQTNPFLHPHSREIRSFFKLSETSTDFEVFESLCLAKIKFSAVASMPRAQGPHPKAQPIPPTHRFLLTRIPDNRPIKNMSLLDFEKKPIEYPTDWRFKILESEPRLFSDGCGAYRLQANRWNLAIRPTQFSIEVDLFGKPDEGFFELIEKLEIDFDVSTFELETDQLVKKKAWRRQFS